MASRGGPKGQAARPGESRGQASPRSRPPGRPSVPTSFRAKPAALPSPTTLPPMLQTEIPGHPHFGFPIPTSSITSGFRPLRALAATQTILRGPPTSYRFPPPDGVAPTRTLKQSTESSRWGKGDHFEEFFCLFLVPSYVHYLQFMKTKQTLRKDSI